MEMESRRKNAMEMTKSQKVVKTVFLVLVWVCLGLYLEITGPTLIDLKIRTRADYEEVAVAVSGRSVGYFIGSAIGGVLVDRFGGFCDLMIGICLSGGAVATVFVPWSPIVQLLWFIIVVQGTFEGVINIAGQKLILNMWKKSAASPLHILHGGFGIGSFIIPLIANPFLAVPKPRPMVNFSMLPMLNTSDADIRTGTVEFKPEEPAATEARLSSMTTDVYIDNRTMFNESEPVFETEYIRESRIEFAYIIAAVLTMALSIVFYVYHIKERKRRQIQQAEIKRNRLVSEKRSIKDMVNPASCAGGKLFYGIEIFFLLFIYFFNIVGGERIMGKFIRAFAIEQRGFSVDEGSYLNTAFWISFAIGRISGFLAARWIPIRILILIETSGVLVTSILMNIFAADNSTALWVLTQPLGLFHAPCFPSGIGWGDFHVEMTGIAITFLLLGGSLGGIAYLRLTGYLFETFGARSFLYHILGYAIASFALAIILDLVGAQHGSRFRKASVDSNEDVSMQAISDKDPDADLLNYKDKRTIE